MKLQRLRSVSMASCFCIAVFLIAIPVLPSDTYGPYRANVVRVKDGDTIEVDVKLWPGLVQRIAVRLDGVNAPEKHGATECERKAAQDATTFTQRWLQGVKEVELTGVRPDKYNGRVLGRISVQGKDLGESLIKAGHARPYNGERRIGWC